MQHICWPVFYHQISFIFFLYSFYFHFECPVGNEKPQRRGSVGSLDSGMSISYTSASTGSRDNAKVRLLQQPFQVSFSFETNKFPIKFRLLQKTNLNAIFIATTRANPTKSRHSKCDEQWNISVIVGYWWHW